MLKKFLKRHKNSCVILIHGDSTYQLNDLVKDVVEIFLTPDSVDFNLDIFDNETFNSDKVILASKKAPFLSPKKVIIIKRIEQIDYKILQNLQSIVEKKGKKFILILVAYKRFDKSALNRKLFKVIPSENILELKKPQGDENSSIIDSILAPLGKTIDENGKFALLSGVENLNQLENELLKLSNVDNDKTVIDIDDVQQHSYLGKSHTVFELLDAIFENNRSKTLTIMNRYFDISSQKDIIMFFVLLHNQFQKIVLFTYFYKKGNSFQDASKKAGLNYFQQKKMRNNIVNLSFSKLLNQYRLLVKYEPKIKFGGVVGYYILEEMICKLLEG